MGLKCRTKSGVLCPVVLVLGQASCGRAMVCCVSDSANFGIQDALCDIHDTQTAGSVCAWDAANAELRS